MCLQDTRASKKKKKKRKTFSSCERMCRRKKKHQTYLININAYNRFVSRMYLISQDFREF